ncbi:MAG: hypothetical protein Q4A00_00580 [Flavobacteriaceae bacterium]|nr:hypothetical protein [Flavobacteriaceae bacterium]
MEEVYHSFASSHTGISYSTIIIFGAFVFLLLSSFLGQKGRISNVLRKMAFFSMMLLYIQSALAFMMAFYSPEFSNLEGVRDYASHFQYALAILICGGLMMRVHFYLKKNEVLSTGIVVVALSSVLIFEYVFPWSKILGV